MICKHEITATRKKVDGCEVEPKRGEAEEEATFPRLACRLHWREDVKHY